jgi:membrane-bound metal-dependent hydrolase YbcI (DUF457 family)|tara:strand:- start:205 stop:468 length:264 start_codon:yes stop_codon:yes gene_type:complete
MMPPMVRVNRISAGIDQSKQSFWHFNTLHSFLFFVLLCMFLLFSQTESAMFATAPVKTIVPTSAILELYGTYRSQFKIRKNEVSGTL